MEFKGTKGEWELSRVNGELITTEDTNVCRIFSMETIEGRANAKLISCAPEMLNLLNRLSIYEYGEPIYNGTIDEIKELIKKAITM